MSLEGQRGEEAGGRDDVGAGAGAACSMGRHGAQEHVQGERVVASSKGALVLANERGLGSGGEGTQPGWGPPGVHGWGLEEESSKAHISGQQRDREGQHRVAGRARVALSNEGPMAF